MEPGGSVQGGARWIICRLGQDRLQELQDQFRVQFRVDPSGSSAGWVRIVSRGCSSGQCGAGHEASAGQVGLVCCEAGLDA